MTSILTNDEKTGMVVQHKKNVAINKYNLELSLIEENAIDQTVQNSSGNDAFKNGIMVETPGAIG